MPVLEVRCTLIPQSCTSTTATIQYLTIRDKFWTIFLSTSASKCHQIQGNQNATFTQSQKSAYADNQRVCQSMKAHNNRKTLLKICHKWVIQPSMQKKILATRPQGCEKKKKATSRGCRHSLRFEHLILYVKNGRRAQSTATACLIIVQWFWPMKLHKYIMNSIMQYIWMFKMNN